MCVIVDANRAAVFFSDLLSGDHEPVVRWIERRGGRLVYGGRLRDELLRVSAAVLVLQQWRLAGRAIEVSDELIDEEETRVGSLGLCRSNDQHVIALARLSGARLLCTSDRLLMDDFRNPRLVPRPRGRIYQRPAHARLLDHSGSCGKQPQRKSR
jgi:hypothetical protein